MSQKGGSMQEAGSGASEGVLVSFHWLLAGAYKDKKSCIESAGSSSRPGGRAPVGT